MTPPCHWSLLPEPWKSTARYERLWLCNVQFLFSSRRLRNTSQSFSHSLIAVCRLLFMPHLCCTCFPFCTSPWHSTGAHQADLHDPRQRETNILMKILQQKQEALDMHSEFSHAPPLRHLVRCEKIKPHSL